MYRLDDDDDDGVEVTLICVMISGPNLTSDNDSAIPNATD
jgi:hypothetical protein